MRSMFDRFRLSTLELANRFVFPPIKLAYGNPDGTVTLQVTDTLALPTSEASSVHNQAVIGYRVFNSWYAAGLRVYDLDPVTGQPVPTGAEGELVVTPLLNMTVPVTRYRTRDIVSVVGLPCTCRRTMTRIVIKRKLTEEPAITIEEPPQEEDVEPEPELVAVGAGVKETEAEAEAGEAGSEPDTGYEEPAESEEEPKPEHEPEPPVDPEVTGDPDK